MVLAASFAPPKANAELILLLPPFQLPPAGTLTKLSRGIEKMKADVWAALRCTNMIVSDREPSGSSIDASPRFESEPRTRKFIGDVLAPGTAWAFGRSPRMSCRVTLFS